MPNLVVPRATRSSRLLHVALTISVLCATLPGPSGHVASAYYISGHSPNPFALNSRIPVYVNKIYSDETHLPYAYADLPFVCPSRPVSAGSKDTVKHHQQALNLGEVLRGDRITESDIQVTAGVDDECHVWCTRELTEEQGKEAERLVREDHWVEWIVDDLPGATTYYAAPIGALKAKFAESVLVRSPGIAKGLNFSVQGSKRYSAGFPLGVIDKATDQVYLNNHVALNILYEPHGKDHSQRLIVGFEVYPTSRVFMDRLCPTTGTELFNTSSPQVRIGGTGPTSVTYTYSVTWNTDPSGTTWGSRWDRYLAGANGSLSDPKIHWYSIINSTIIAFFLSAMAMIILLRALNRDIMLYTDVEDEFGGDDGIGWKLVHGDVFRTPKALWLLAALYGTGLQIGAMIMLTICFGLLGLINPSFRGGLVTFAVFSFAFMSVFAGFHAVRLARSFKGTSWRRTVLATCTLIPTLYFCTYFAANFFVWGEQSSAAVPFGTLLALLCLWLGIEVPLAIAGGYTADRRPVVKYPTRTNLIQRQIPTQPWYLSSIVVVLVGGLMPFAVVFIELYFIMKSIWLEQYFYMYGFLAIVGVILVLTTAEIAIIITYFQLCSEDYRWWWRSYLVSASSGLYIFVYAMYYYHTRLRIEGFVPSLLYFINTGLLCGLYALAMGSIGFGASWWFVRKIFAAVKAD